MRAMLECSFSKRALRVHCRQALVPSLGFIQIVISLHQVTFFFIDRTSPMAEIPVSSRASAA
jgi:hypothetical protein